MSRICTGGATVVYTLSRSRRKTAAIYIRNGSVEVRAPLRMPKRDIDFFVASKADWIVRTIEASREQARNRDTFALGYGDSILYRGALYPITATQDACTHFDGTAFCLPCGLSPEEIKDACVQVYRSLALRHLPALTLSYARRMDLAPAAVKISAAQTRWGSCSGRGSINFSWRLIMAGDDVIEYVVIHELAHLAEMNHSARFWHVVGGVLPDYRERRERKA